MRTLKRWSDAILAASLTLLLIWTSGQWDSAALEAILVFVACCALVVAAMSCAVATLSPHRDLFTLPRKMAMIAVSLTGFLASLFPTIALPVLSAHPGNGDMALHHFLLAIGLLGQLVAFAALIAPPARVLNEISRRQRAAWQAARNEHRLPSTDA